MRGSYLKDSCEGCNKAKKKCSEETPCKKCCKDGSECIKNWKWKKRGRKKRDQMAQAQQQQQQQQQQLIQRPNIIHSSNNNNQNTMSSTNTPVVALNHTALYVRPVNQGTIVQQSQQQSTNNNNINNVSIPQQTRPSTIFQPSINQLSYSSSSLVTPSSSVAQANNTSIIDNNSGSGSKNNNKNNNNELNFTATNSLMPANDQIIPPIANKTISLTVPNKKYKLENEQENKSSDSHENLNKKRRLEIHVTDRNEIKNNNSENVNNYSNSIDSPKDYDEETSFEELYESIRKLDNTMKNNMDTGEAAKGTEESHIPCRMYVENSSDLDCISSSLSKSA